MNGHSTFLEKGTCTLQVPDTGMGVSGNTGYRGSSIVTCSYIILSCSRSYKYPRIESYWYVIDIPTLSNTGSYWNITLSWDLKYTFFPNGDQMVAESSKKNHTNKKKKKKQNKTKQNKQTKKKGEGADFA